jgi:hypothetical protein
MGEFDKAKDELQSAISLDPGSNAAKQAEGALYEINHLSPGQPAPAFVTQARNGLRVSLADYSGKVVLIIFWSST